MRKFKISLSFFLGLAAILGTATIFYYIFSQGFLKAKPVELVLDETAKDEQAAFDKIYDAMRVQLKPYENIWVWNLNLPDVLKTIELDPRIQTTQVLRTFPNRVTVVIRPKLSNLNLLDQDGDLHPVTNDGALLPPFHPTQAPDRPTLRGPQFFTNQSLREKAVKLIEQLPEKGNFSKASVSEVHFDKSGFSFILIGNGLTVKVSEDTLSESVNHVEQVLAYLQGQRIKGRVIDARYAKKVVVKLRKQP